MDPAFYNLPYKFSASLRRDPQFSQESFERIKNGLLNNGWEHELSLERNFSIFTATFHSLELYHQIPRPVSDENQGAQAEMMADFNRTFSLISTENPPPPLVRRRDRQYYNENHPVDAWTRLTQGLATTGISMAEFTNAVRTFSTSAAAAAFTTAHIAPYTPAPPTSWNELAMQYYDEESHPAPQLHHHPTPAKPLPIHVRCGVRKIHRATP